MTEIEQINKMLSEKGIAVTKLAKEIGMSEKGLRLMLKGKDLKISRLKAIAKYLRVPIFSFFETNNENIGDYNINIIGGIVEDNSIMYGKDAEIERLKVEIKHLKIQLKDKEQIIELLTQNK